MNKEIAYEKFEQIRSRWTRRGALAGKAWLEVKAFVLWRLPKRRVKLFKHGLKLKPRRWKQFFEMFQALGRIPYVKCKMCESVGLDHRSEDYGWAYLGHHMWECPKCQGRGQNS